MSTIDAAIIKALVEHVDGDSSGIPDGVIGGKTYTAGDAIDLTNDKISVKYDSTTMQLKDGKLAAKASDNGPNTAGKSLSVFRNFKVVGTTLGFQLGIESNDFPILKYKTTGGFYKLMLVTKASDKLTFIDWTNTMFEFNKVTDSSSEFKDYYTYTFNAYAGTTPDTDQSATTVYSHIFTSSSTSYVIPSDDMMLLILTILKRQEIGQRLHLCS